MPADDLEAEVGSVLDVADQGDPPGTRRDQDPAQRSVLADIDALGDDLASMSARLFGCDEAREAMRAFLEKRSK